MTFDGNHVSKERSHGVTEAQAKQYIRDAKISVTVWNGQFERYYGENGAIYVNTEKSEYDENLKSLIKEMKKNGILG